MPFVFRIPPILFLFLASQVYWIWALVAFLRRTRNPLIGIAFGVPAAALYLLLFWLNLLSGEPAHEPTHMTLREAAVQAPFLWWIFSSTIGFVVVLLTWLLRLPVLLVSSLRRRFVPSVPQENPQVPARRQFLEQAATAVTAVPFVAGAYGLLWGRLNLEVTRQPIRLPRLPQGFHGFRIAQLSDIHVGPYMSEDQIRKYARVVNELKPDLIALTGDFVTWDAATQNSVVAALSCLKAPFGVYGCLGNHDAWADAEDSITELFAHTGIHILRQERTLLQSGGDVLNLIGIDFANSRLSAGAGHLSSKTLTGVERLMVPGTANILLSHNPDTFDRAAELGIDLSLAGHTHGGQLALEFISPQLAPSRLVTPYVAGWFQKPGGQLYVNRGIGTIAAPMRVGAPPEITIYELLRA